MNTYKDYLTVYLSQFVLLEQKLYMDLYIITLWRVSASLGYIHQCSY